MAEEEKKVPYSDIVYRTPGLHAAYNGKTFEFEAVTSKEDHAQKLKDGWCDSLVEAVEGKEETPVDTNSQPTRDECKEKAKELGLTFPGNISTVKLIALIEAKLKDK